MSSAFGDRGGYRTSNSPEAEKRDNEAQERHYRRDQKRHRESQKKRRENQESSYANCTPEIEEEYIPSVRKTRQYGAPPPYIPSSITQQKQHHRQNRHQKQQVQERHHKSQKKRRENLESFHANGAPEIEEEYIPSVKTKRRYGAPPPYIPSSITQQKRHHQKQQLYRAVFKIPRVKNEKDRRSASLLANPATVPKSSAQKDCRKFTISISRGTDKIKSLLNKNGFVIIKDVLNVEECKSLEDEVWNSMENITARLDVPISRSNPDTWSSMKCVVDYDDSGDRVDKYNSYGISHAEFFWNLRQHPSVLLIFAGVHGCAPTDLLVSFDGLHLSIPDGSSTGTVTDYDKTYTCADGCLYQFFSESFKRRSFQSFVVSRDVEPGDYTLSFLAGSQRLYRDIYHRQQLRSRHFYEYGHERVTVTCPAGSLVLWDSSILHGWVRPTTKSPNSAPNARCFLSYGPRSNVSEMDLERRVALFRRRRATSHWTDDRTEIVTEKRDLEGSRLTKLTSNLAETEMLKRLVGFSTSVLERSPFNREECGTSRKYKRRHAALWCHAGTIKKGVV